MKFRTSSFPTRVVFVLLQAAGLILGLFFGLAGRAAEKAAAEGGAPATVEIEFALYFAPKPSADPEKEIVRLLGEPERRLVSAKADPTPDTLAAVLWHWSPIKDYAPPSAEALSYTGVGLEAAYAAKLAAAERVFIVGFVARARDALPANRAACQLLADLAAATEGIPWDEETRQLFSLQEWRASRLKNWQEGLPDFTSHVTLHAYAHPELIRIVTLGMRKFALPDLSITNLPRQQTRSLGNTINALVQRLGEGQKPEAGKLVLTLADIRHTAARERALTHPGKGAKGKVTLALTPVTPEAGDPANAQWKLDFPGAPMKAYTERALWGAAELFGSTDRIVNTSSADAEMAAARAKARKAFFAQEARFRAGLAVNERLLVKSPFTAGEHTEYMWVEVVKWGPKHVEGILSSDPGFVKTLHAGSKVTVPLADIFDYIYYRADGTEEGNESGKVLEKLEKQQKQE